MSKNQIKAGDLISAGMSWVYCTDNWSCLVLDIHWANMTNLDPKFWDHLAAFKGIIISPENRKDFLR